MNESVRQMLTRKAVIAHSEGFIFERNGAQLNCSYVSHRFKKYVRSGGLNGGIHFHSLRHTFASLLAFAAGGVAQHGKQDFIPLELRQENCYLAT